VARANRREDFLAVALELFVERGYEGTSVADLAAGAGLSKAAFVYHFGSKEDLLVELSEPLLDELDAVLDRHQSAPPAERRPEAALADYLDALHRHQRVAQWIDGDKSVLNHEHLGARLRENSNRVHRLLSGRARPSRRARALSSAVLGMLWRPIRNGHLPDDPASHQAVVAMAARAVDSI